MKPKAKPIDLTRLLVTLCDGKWHLSKNIPGPHRMIRAVCSEFPDKVLSGQAGYKVVRAASNAEVETAIADLRSRIEQLNRRACALQTVLVERTQDRLRFER